MINYVLGKRLKVFLEQQTELFDRDEAVSVAVDASYHSVDLSLRKRCAHFFHHGLEFLCKRPIWLCI